MKNQPIAKNPRAKKRTSNPKDGSQQGKKVQFLESNPSERENLSKSNDNSNLNIQEISLTLSKDFESLIDADQNSKNASALSMEFGKGAKLDKSELQISEISQDHIIMQKVKELAKNNKKVN